MEQPCFFHGAVNNIHRAFHVALLIRILDTQDKIAAFMLCDQISIQCGSQIPTCIRPVGLGANLVLSLPYLPLL